MKILLLILSVSVSAATFKIAEKKRSPSTLRKLYQSVSKYREIYIEETVNDFVKKTRPNRFLNSKGHLAAREFILNHINSNKRKDGVSTKTIKFIPDIEYAKNLYKSDLENIKNSGSTMGREEIQKWTRFTNERVALFDKLSNTNGYNIVWEKKGTSNSKDVLVVGTHYDSAGYDKNNLKLITDGPQPGADNNASGVTAALSLISILSELELEKTVRVVFFDFHELGFLGSYDYARTLSLEKSIRPYAYVELIMLGHDSMNLDKEKKLGNMKLYYSSRKSKTHKVEKVLAEKFFAKSSKGTFKVKFTPYERNFINGDNISFQKFDIPSLVYTQNWESDLNIERIHTPADHVASLNINTLHNGILNISMAIASWALPL